MSSVLLWSSDAISDQVLAIRDLAHVEEAGADRRVGPLVQADAVVVAIQVGDLVGELAEGVGAVHNHRDVARVRHLADPLDREDLAGAIGDVADQDQLGLAA